MSSGSRNSSTYRIRHLSLVNKHYASSQGSRSPSPGARAYVFAVIFKAIPANFFDGLLGFSEHSEQVHLLHRIALADLAHCEADVNQNPLANRRKIVLQ